MTHATLQQGWNWIKMSKKTPNKTESHIIILCDCIDIKFKNGQVWFMVIEVRRVAVTMKELTKRRLSSGSALDPDSGYMGRYIHKYVLTYTFKIFWKLLFASYSSINQSINKASSSSHLAEMKSEAWRDLI